MGTVHVEISDELEMKFRQLILQKFGTKKGALTMAIEEAIKLWVEKESKILPTREPEG